MKKQEYQNIKNQVLSFINSDYVKEAFEQLETFENEIVSQELKQVEYSEKCCALLDKIDVFKIDNKIPYFEKNQTGAHKNLMKPLMEEEAKLKYDYQVYNFINENVLNNFRLNNRFNTCYNITYKFLNIVYDVDVEQLNSLENYEQRNALLKPVLENLQDFIKYDSSARGENILTKLPHNLQFEIMYGNGFIIHNRRSNIKIYSYMFWLCGVINHSYRKVLSLSDFRAVYNKQLEIEKTINKLCLESQELLRNANVDNITTYDKYSKVDITEEYLYSFKADFNK